jgi:DNA-directed RNA polymerase specialized sigma24 family protein
VGPSDAELIARVVGDDDRHAFAALVRRHQSAVRALLRRLTCGDAARADDLAQDAFLRAYRGLPGFRGGAKFSSWLYRIAYNVFLSDGGRKVVSPPVDDVAAPAAPVAGLRLDLDQGLRRLSEPERLAVVLSYNEGATHEEIAGVLGCPLGTAKSHVLRGRQRLREYLSDWSEGERDASHG